MADSILGPLEFVGQTDRGTARAYLTEDKKVLIPYLTQRPREKPPGNTKVNALVIDALTAAGALALVGDTVYLRSSRRWIALTKIMPTKQELSDQVHYLAVQEAGLLDPENWTFTSSNGVPEHLEAQLNSMEDVTVKDDPPYELATLLSTQHDRTGMRKAKGQLCHPIVSPPSGAYWLFDECDLPEPDPTYPLLRELYAGLDLDPASHVQLYSWLLAFFHGVSLTEDRPILLVDSWKRGRGKSQVCGSICTLLNGGTSQLTFSKNEEKLTELVVSDSDKRAINLDNLCDVRAFSSPLLSSLSTGAATVRRKYDRNSSSLPGKAILASTVYGAASFAQDLLTRTARVELRGEPQLLLPNPRDHAQDNLAGLRAECYHAMQQIDTKEKVFTGKSTRFERFDSVGLLGYREVFSMALPAAVKLLEASRRGARGLRQEVMQALHRHAPEAFEDASDRAFEAANAFGAAIQLPSELNGAIGLGHTLSTEGDGPTWSS